MKIISHLSIALVMGLFMVSCSNGQQKAAEGSIAENVNVEEFTQRIENAQIVDVRTPAEWNEGIVEGAIMNDIYEDDFEKQLEKLDKEKPVAVYCKVGGRSGQAMGKMNKLGFKEVYNLDGGMDAWKSAGKPTVKP